MIMDRDMFFEGLGFVSLALAFMGGTIGLIAFGYYLTENSQEKAVNAVCGYSATVRHAEWERLCGEIQDLSGIEYNK